MNELAKARYVVWGGLVGYELSTLVEATLVHNEVALMIVGLTSLALIAGILGHSVGKKLAENVRSLGN